ncbi:unannotated protein [freshwater metagenome]|uniref:Unannotated protein n=1 Tax=freshwater metagenome TaxID=449393 RepID=A0A6J7QLZ4_9ZZZZ
MDVLVRVEVIHLEALGGDRVELCGPLALDVGQVDTTCGDARQELAP